MKVCIDPGHGMANKKSGVFDPGATAERGAVTFREADATLDYGLHLQQVLTGRGAEIFMTRSNHTDPTPVATRANRAKAAGCKLYVSFHLNADDNVQAHGLEVLYGNDASKPFAAAMQAKLIVVTGLRDRQIKLRTDLAVLKFIGPAVLIELGFISNDADRTTLLKSAMRDAICSAVADVTMAQP